MSQAQNTGGDGGLGRNAVRGIVAGVISDTILEIAFGISLVVGQMFDAFNSALRQGGAAVGRPFRIGGSSLIGIAGSLGGFVLDLAGVAGPAAPLAGVVIVAVVVALIGTGVRIVIGVII